MKPFPKISPLEEDLKAIGLLCEAQHVKGYKTGDTTAAAVSSQVGAPPAEATPGNPKKLAKKERKEKAKKAWVAKMKRRAATQVPPVPGVSPMETEKQAKAAALKRGNKAYLQKKNPALARSLQGYGVSETPVLTKKERKAKQRQAAKDRLRAAVKARKNQS